MDRINLFFFLLPEYHSEYFLSCFQNNIIQVLSFELIQSSLFIQSQISIAFFPSIVVFTCKNIIYLSFLLCFHFHRRLPISSGRFLYTSQWVWHDKTLITAAVTMINIYCFMSVVGMETSHILPFSEKG